MRTLRYGRGTNNKKSLLGMQPLWEEISGIIMKDTTKEKSKQNSCWLWWMMLGEKTGCHQLPERSFFIKGYQFPVCARCTGVLVGYLIAMPVFALKGICVTVSIMGTVIMFLDWMLQATGIKQSTNSRRFITGLLGGFGIMSVQLYLISKVINRVCHN